MSTRPYLPGEPKRGSWAWMKWRVEELERLNAHYRETLERVARARGGRVLDTESSKRLIEAMGAPAKEPTPGQIRAFDMYRTKVTDPRGDTFFTPRSEVTTPKVIEWKDDSIHEIPDRASRFHRVLGLLIVLGVVVAFWYGMYCIYALSTGSYATYTKGVGK